MIVILLYCDVTYNPPLNNHLFLREPLGTTIGKKLVEESILLIESIGFEAFTFKKLAFQIESAESTVYRYFENKTQLLCYLVAYYWSWLEFKISYALSNLNSPEQKLKVALSLIVHPKKQIEINSYLDEQKLYRVVATESLKSYFNKEVDQNNKEGLYADYKRLCDKIAHLILDFNPAFLYPHALVTMIIESAHHQLYYAQHLPKLTNFKSFKEADPLLSFLECVLFSALK